MTTYIPARSRTPATVEVAPGRTVRYTARCLCVTTTEAGEVPYTPRHGITRFVADGILHEAPTAWLYAARGKAEAAGADPISALTRAGNAWTSRCTSDLDTLSADVGAGRC